MTTTATAEELGFLQAICMEPSGDTNRLVYADWLEEHGQPERAEFIRVQVELARPRICEWRTKRRERAGYVYCKEWNDLLGEGRMRTWCHTCSETKQLRARERELLFARSACGQTNGFAWSEPLHSLGFATGNYVLYTFSRGFVSRITCTAEDWLRHCDQVYWHPEQVDLIGSNLFRPFPATAQPIERVVLTTGPVLSFADWPEVNWQPSETGFTCSRWPGLIFEVLAAGRRYDDEIPRNRWPADCIWAG